MLITVWQVSYIAQPVGVNVPVDDRPVLAPLPHHQPALPRLLHHDPRRVVVAAAPGQVAVVVPLHTTPVSGAGLTCGSTWLLLTV